MAHIAKRETSMRRNGRPVVRWVVRWDDPVRDSNGVPVREESDGRGKGRIKVRRRERAFEAERDALDFLATVSKDHRDGKRPDYRAGDEPFGTFAASWLDSMRAEVKARTVESYESQLRTWIGPRFGHQAVGSITPADARAFRDELRAAGLSASSMRSAIAPLRRILNLAVEDGVISTNPAASVKLLTAKKMARDFEARPVSSADVATVAGVMAAPWDLLTLFAA